MKRQVFQAVAVGAGLASAVWAQGFPRQATMVGGNQDRGKCTIEVVVDDVAQVEIRGTTAVLRTLSGMPAQWRRFECNSPLPPNPVGFRFAGVDGRGRQDLVRDPREGGAAVIQIEDKKGGTEGYTFDIFWENRGGYVGGYDGRPGMPDSGRYDGPPPPPRSGYGDYGRGGNFGPEAAVRVCQDEIRVRASRRFRTDNIQFRRIAMDDGAGRRDWVVGVLEVRWGPRVDRFGFNCSVDFRTGRVRTADVDPDPLRDERRWR